MPEWWARTPARWVQAGTSQPMRMGAVQLGAGTVWAPAGSWLARLSEPSQAPGTKPSGTLEVPHNEQRGLPYGNDA